MRKSIFTVLAFVCISHMLQEILGQCQSSGFKGCECNIMGACTTAGTPKPGLNDELTGYSPNNIDQFRYVKNARNLAGNLAYLCEDNTVAILYDCNARIPLYAATVMTGNQLKAGYKQIKMGFKFSGDSKLDQAFQQKDKDYTEYSERAMCYESQRPHPTGNHYFVDVDWYKANSGKIISLRTPCPLPFVPLTPVHRGHLVAASYGRGDTYRIRATYKFTNVVPQFGRFNSGQWRSSETRLIAWGRDNCIVYKGSSTQNVRMYIIVGVIPSTFRNLNERFFGESGFSDYQSWSKMTDTYKRNSGGKEYRINVPRYMWTAACCTFQYKDGKGKLKDGTRSTAFFRENEPGRSMCYTPGTMNGLFMSITQGRLLRIDLFPATHSECYHSGNFISTV